MIDWKDTFQYLKEFLNTLAGKLTAILAFALLVIIVLSAFGASIPQGYQALVYIVVIGAMLIFAFQAVMTVTSRRKELKKEPEPIPGATPEQGTQGEKPLPVPLDPEKARRDYLVAVIADSRLLRLAGLDESAGDPTTVRLALEDIYVALNTRTMIDIEEKGKKQERGDFAREKQRPLPALEALVQSPRQRMVLLGLPGTGKSTFVRYLALRVAQEMLGAPRRLEDWQGKAVLPIAISLGRFAETLPAGATQGTTAMLEVFLRNTVEADSRYAAFAPLVLSILQEEGGLVMFDGLDEVADLSLRPVVVQAVEAFTEKYARNPGSRFLVTCRTYSYRDKDWQLTGWPVHELDLLNNEQIAQFVNAWYDQHSLLDPARELEYREKRLKLLEALRSGDRRRLYEVAPYPIILTIMAIVHASYELPDSRAQVYMQCVKMLLEKWQTKRSIMGRVQNRSLLAELGIPETRLYQALFQIAYEAHLGRTDQSEDGGSLITGKLVAGGMLEHLQDEHKLKIFLDYCQSANGLLMLQGTITPAEADPSAPPRRVYTFPHMTFEEYLAGRHLEWEGADRIRTLLDSAYDRWVEVVKFLAEYLCFERADRDRMNGLLEALSTPFPDHPTEKDWRALWLAGELLLLYRRAIPKPSPYEPGIIERLPRLVETCALTPRERAAAADVLDQFWQPQDLYSFVPIRAPAGEFLIAKYPVTNAQYRRFLTRENFTDPSLWVDIPRFSEPDEKGEVTALENWGAAGWDWLQKALEDKNYVEEGVLYPRFWRDVHFGIGCPSAPAVGISWWEANAYCKWLLAHWDELEESQNGSLPKPKQIRLPTETEWVLAAGGEQNGRFAFGELNNPAAEISRYANTDESNIGRTTPVWMYTQGASPAGVTDMSGNVWEWQANFRDKDRDFISLCGGSGNGIGYLARVEYRYHFLPSGWSYLIGFRVVALPN
ncbi:MAG: SUMF1/EgtB/PvdO family nonheme iron enzyme [Bellilinea sp.]|jgi:formylglycine-generating enzyme required for sulfatase activity